ncbi:MAG: hypothetical protein AB7S75_02460 [Desulfococcaceae bacterium]
MQRIDEENLSFSFGDQWQVCKLDDHPFYRNRMEKIDGTKALDFLGIYDKKELYFIEVKDFREYRIKSKKRISNGELIIEIAQKVTGSISCIIGAYRMENNPELWNPYAEMLLNKSIKLKVILWLETDFPLDYVSERQKGRNSVSTKILKQKMNWITSHVLSCSLRENKLPDMEVRNLPMQENL